MKFDLKPLLLAGLIAGGGLAAHAQAPSAAASESSAPSASMPPGQVTQHGMRERMHGGDDGARMQRRGERMQERAAHRMARMKTQLQITRAQEGAWDTFAGAMQPNPAAMKKMHAARAELQSLTTPERIDRMRALRAERMAAMDQRLDATKALYAQLNPLQQKAFDQIAAERMGRGRHGMGRGHHGDQHGDHHSRGGDHERHHPGAQERHGG